MPKRSALELLEHYYQALIYSLPMKNRDFMEDLNKHGLLTGSFKTKLEALSTNKEMASYFLDHVIKARLAVNDKICFVNLLNVMNDSKYDNVKDLAKEIESEYDVNAKCYIQPKESELHRYIVPKFAAKWRDLGVQLEIPTNNLDVIAADHPSQSERCCKAMLLKWMEITPEPAWDKLQKSIGHLSGLSDSDSSKNKDPKLEINLLMNILPFIQKKWQLIGLALGLSSHLLDKIYIEAEKEQIPSKSFNTFCCVKVLKHWFMEGDNVANFTLIKAISTPRIHLKNEILSNISTIITDKKLSSVPLNCVKSHGEMKANVCKQLCNFHCSINVTLQYLQNANVDLKSIANFKDLIDSLEMNKLMHAADVCWLINIVKQAQCEGALKLIQAYCDLLIADKVLWGDSQTSKSNTCLVAKVSGKTSYNCTIKHCADVKTKLNIIIGLSETDSILSFSEMNSKDCSLTFYWRIKDNILITIPKVIVTLQKEHCINLGITHIGTAVDGNLKITNISELQVKDYKAAASPQPTAQEHKLPAKLLTNKDLIELKVHYDAILHLMPENYELTINSLLDYINDDQIGIILCSSSSAIANKKILDYLIERVHCKLNLFELCDQLESITTSHDMKTVINEIRLEVQKSIQRPTSTAPTVNKQSSSSSNHQHQLSSSSTSDSIVFQSTFRNIGLDPNSKVLAVLKKNYTKLCHCLPKNYMKTINKLKQLLNPSDEHVQKWIDIAAANLFNETVVGMLMATINTDSYALNFCDMMEKLCDSDSSRMYIEMLRKEFLEAFSSPTVPIITKSFTITQPLTDAIATVNTNVSEQIGRSTIAPGVSAKPSATTVKTNVSERYDKITTASSASIKSSITDVNSATELPQGSTTPELSKLQRDIVPKYAARWRDLGIQLSIQKDALDIIARDNVHEREYSRNCCRCMLNKWIETNAEATWNGLHNAIANLPPLSPKLYSYLHPPKLPSNHVNRKSLVDYIATILLKATDDPKKYESTLTITGAAGFGKTTTVISLCHHPAVKEHFTDGFVVIKLGTQAIEPSVKLNHLYHLLTGEYLKYCDIKYAGQLINQLTSKHYKKLLVIIDDVWKVEDAKPLVDAFSNCNTILTTRKNDIELQLESKESVNIGPMTQLEAFTLLTSGVIDKSQLSQEDVSLLDELAQDVHLWPLLLSLIRGQLSNSLKQHLSCSKAIKKVQDKLLHKGLPAFGNNNTKAINKSAVKACMEVTLELLTESLSDKMKSLILWTGIDTSLQVAVLSNLWNIPEKEAKVIADKLWSYGLVQFTDIRIFPNNITQHCVEVHVVISQYIIECMDSSEVYNLAPHGGKLNTAVSINEGLSLAFQQSYGIHDLLSLNAVDYLKYKLNEIENSRLPYFVKSINMYTVVDPHPVIKALQAIDCNLMNTSTALTSLKAEIDSLISDCKQLIKDASRSCRKLNQTVQINLYEKDYDKLIQSIEEFNEGYALCSVVQKAVTTVKKVKSFCDGELQDYVMYFYEHLQIRTHDYHHITTLTLPYIKLYVNLHKKIYYSLQNGSPHIEKTYYYIMFGKFNEDYDLIETSRLIKLKAVAPNWVRKETSQQ